MHISSFAAASTYTALPPHTLRPLDNTTFHIQETCKKESISLLKCSEKPGLTLTSSTEFVISTFSSEAISVGQVEHIPYASQGQKGKSAHDVPVENR